MEYRATRDGSFTDDIWERGGRKRRKISRILGDAAREARAWLVDKRNWLGTFNKLPKVCVNGTVITPERGRAIFLEGRAELIVKGDIYSSKGVFCKTKCGAAEKAGKDA